MHDIKEIRDNPKQFDVHLKRRGLPSCSGQILDLDKKLRAVIEKLQSLQQERNQVAAQMAQAKKSNQDAVPFVERGSLIKKEIPALEEEGKGIRDQISSLLAGLPNILSSDTPDGASEEDNVEILKKGACRDFSFTPREHFEIGEQLGLMDFQGASDLSGSRFVLLKGALAQLERALAQFMVDMHTSKMGYELVSTPLLVKDPAMYGTGQLPKFSEDAFQTTKGHWLIPTAEVPLTCLAANKIIDEKVLPLRYTAHTACFRSEAGSAGKDTRGMLRQHQFYKVELVSLVTAEQAENEFKHMVSAACSILDALQLPYRVMQLCSGDVGFSAKKTYDLEVWLPGQKAYREISSCSYCGPFQAQRMNGRYRSDNSKKPAFLHTLNGSGIAVGRALIAVIENYQQEDGSITVPDVLIPYMNGRKEVKNDR